RTCIKLFQRGLAMPNCDWGRPCDCRECRTKARVEICPHCGFKNTVELVGTAEFKTDRKGIGYYEISYPNGPAIDLKCRKCEREICAVPYYTGVDEHRCKEQLQHDAISATAKPCSRCATAVKWSLEGYRAIELMSYLEEFLCRECLEKAVEADTPDP